MDKAYAIHDGWMIDWLMDGVVYCRACAIHDGWMGDKLIDWMDGWMDGAVYWACAIHDGWMDNRLIDWWIDDRLMDGWSEQCIVGPVQLG